LVCREPRTPVVKLVWEAFQPLFSRDGLHEAQRKVDFDGLREAQRKFVSLTAGVRGRPCRACMHVGVLSILTKRALNEKGNGALQCAYMIVILMVGIAKLRTETFLNCTHKIIRQVCVRERTGRSGFVQRGACRSFVSPLWRSIEPAWHFVDANRSISSVQTVIVTVVQTAAIKR